MRAVFFAGCLYGWHELRELMVIRDDGTACPFGHRTTIEAWRRGGRFWGVCPDHGRVRMARKAVLTYDDAS